MPLKDLSGKTVYDLEREDFVKLFCEQCQVYDDCPRDARKMNECKVFIDNGLWDAFYRKRQDG